ncbi:tRNA 5-hydroxyuridine modification protein YegQ [Marinomonas mediterranea]|jgi:Collagenase and related proteases|uniref:Peptidase U32 n=1 Tax=Marinomonas mediterranea (strain ATCC 700492 / JCM 21426 / NBRC 103028 / MMB-1) TaxID=717774 RepID=F2K2S8_MARM1|nr:tRNA 5-hydroxyuridine modification protein YegQ [Marinomonas mediterranea]ADZ91211.1 peptidase U32 [Marinomonas mediterranea MMB-1]WCN13269.1 tRNA 5-hydroxyuridine modification protein YegQ [Marinomonas mediterranea]WCN17337.1 tRNA 5-hydroxyuridine modification protein YegQ [Marinomonas mediterranea MMB-1]
MTELLSPAGTLKNMRYAYAYGADAVYAGQPRYSLRVRNNDFDMSNLATGIEEAHKQGKSFYVASNIAPHNAKIKTYLKDIEPVIEMGPDALIMSDPGMMMLVKEKWPDMPIHLSVQANAVNWATVKFWHDYGLTRVILSRELSLDEIGDIRQQVPEMEIETFVHGSLCIAYSGRCLLSGYFNRRDPNQGTCTNSCRWQYDVKAAKELPTGDIVPADGSHLKGVQEFTPDGSEESTTLGVGKPFDDVVLLREQGREGEYMPAFEDEHGTYIMNSRDLRAIQHVERLIEMGVHSLKIEGRTKSHFYAARTAQLYRQAIDDATYGKAFDMSLLDRLEGLANRGYTEGFYRRHVHDKYQNYQHGNSTSTHQQFVGEMMEYNNGWLSIDVKNRFKLGDTLELITPSGGSFHTITEMENLKGERMDVAPGSGHKVRIALDRPDFNTEFGLVMRNLPN